MSYNLGFIKGSRDFEFLLRSTGDVPVTDIVISSSNEAFGGSGDWNLVRGDRRAVLACAPSRALHGVVLEGQGMPALPMGEHSPCFR